MIHINLIFNFYIFGNFKNSEKLCNENLFHIKFLKIINYIKNKEKFIFKIP